jgi:hypothetical protein
VQISFLHLYLTVASISTLLAVIVAIKAFVLRKHLSGNYSLFFYFFITDALFDLIGFVFFIRKINNSLPLDLFSMIGFLLISIPFLKHLKYLRTRKIFIVLIIIVLLVSIYWLFDPLQIKKFDLIPMALQSSVLMFLSAIILFNLSSNPSINIFNSSVFWFALGAFLYSLIDSVITSGLNFLIEINESMMVYVYIASPLVSLAKLTCFFKGLSRIRE